jgi:integrase
VLITELIKLFMDSRKRGTGSAVRRAQPKTLAAYEWNFKVIVNWLTTEARRGEGGVIHYSELKRSVIGEFIDWLEAKVQRGEYSESTRLQILRTLRAFFYWIDDDEDLRDEGLRGLQKHLPRIQTTPRRSKPETKEIGRFKNLFDTSKLLGYRDYVATCLMLATGMRLGEVCDLKIEDVFLEDRLLEFRGKGGDRRRVSLPSDVVPLLKVWLRRRSRIKRAQNSAYLFVSKYSEKMEVSAWASRFRLHCKKHGLPNVTAHTLRHQFVTTCAKKNTNIASIMRMTGHKSHEMVMRYINEAELEGKALQDEMDRVNPLNDL